MATLTTSYQLINEARLGTSGGTLYIRIYAKYNKQDIGKNETSITYQARANYTGGYIISQQPTYIRINGTGISETTVQYNAFEDRKDGYFYKGETTLKTITGTVKHNNDGTQSISCSAYMNCGPWGWSATASGKATLPTIPRASSITATDANIGSATTITINKAVSGFTTTIFYKASDESSWTKIVDKTPNASYGWYVPTSFYSKIPNAKTITCSFYADTYNGDTYIGSSSAVTATFTATGNPIINSTSVIDSNSTTTNITKNNRTLVRYVSNAYIEITTTPQNSSSISRINCNGIQMSLSNNKGTLTISNISTNKFDVEVIDSRGYSTWNTFYSQGFVSYIRTSISPTIVRNQPTDGIVNITGDGDYYNGNIGQTPNTLTLSYRYKTANGDFTNWTNLNYQISGNRYSITPTQVTEIDYQQQYIFEIKVNDKITSSAVNNILIMKGQPVYWWNDNKFVSMKEIWYKNLPAFTNLHSEKYVSDLNDALATGQYQYSPYTLNSPHSQSVNNNSYGFVLVFSNSQNAEHDYFWIYQIAYGTGGGIHIRRKINKGANWTRWEHLTPIVYDVIASAPVDYVNISNLDLIEDGGMYEIEIVGSTTVSTDIRMLINEDTSANYCSVGAGFTTTSTTETDINTPTGALRLNRNHWYYGFHFNAGLCQTKISLYLEAHIKTPVALWTSSWLDTNESGTAQVSGKLKVQKNNITSIQFAPITGKFKTGTRFLVRRVTTNERTY